MKIKIIASWILSALILISGFLILKNHYPSANTLNSVVHIKVLGAVVRKKVVTLPIKSTMYDLVSRITLSPTANRKDIDWKKVFVNDQTVIFSKITKSKKIIVNNKTRIEDLKQLGVSTKLKKELFKYFKTHKKWNWEDIDLLPGVGIATLKLLKEQLDISYGI